MRPQDDLKAEKTDFRRDIQEISVNCRFNLADDVARGAGFEPARPKGPQT